MANAMTGPTRRLIVGAAEKRERFPPRTIVEAAESDRSLLRDAFLRQRPHC